MFIFTQDYLNGHKLWLTKVKLSFWSPRITAAVFCTLILFTDGRPLLWGMYLERVLDIFIIALAFFSTKIIWGGEKSRWMSVRQNFLLNISPDHLMKTLLFQDVCRLDQRLVPRLGLAWPPMGQPSLGQQWVNTLTRPRLWWAQALSKRMEAMEVKQPRSETDRTGQTSSLSRRPAPPAATMATGPRS